MKEERGGEEIDERNTKVVAESFVNISFNVLESGVEDPLLHAP